MKVALITFHSFIRPGGVKRHVLGLHEEFKRQGIYSKIIVPRRERSENYGKDVILLGTSFPVIIGGTQADFVVNFNPLAIEKVLKKEKFDVLHFHNFILPSSWQILENSRALNILTIHADIAGVKSLWKVPGLFYLWKKIIRWKIDGLIGVAPLSLNGFENFKGPKTIIPNGINLEEFDPRVKKIKKFLDPERKPPHTIASSEIRGRSASYGAGGKINLLFVGRIEERKGLIYLLRAYQILERKFKNLRLIIVGEGPLKGDCEDFVKENDLKEIHFEEEKTDQELVSYYNTADIFISPAIFGESFGIVLLEAMACGKPVVAFANEGYKEFLKGKKGGVLAKNRDENDLTEKISALIENPKLRKKMGERGLNEAKEYAWQKISARILDFYKLCKKEKKIKSP